MHSSRHLWWGVALILLGLLFLLDTSGYIDAGEAVREFWPALLVVLGIFLLIRRRGSAPPPVSPPFRESSSSTADRLNSSTVFGDAKITFSAPAFKGGYLSTVFGDTDVDLSSCGWAEGEQELRISSVFGDVDILVPRNEAIAVNASAVFGSMAVKDQHRDGFASSLMYESPGFAEAPKKLRIHVTQVFGDIQVRE